MRKSTLVIGTYVRGVFDALKGKTKGKTMHLTQYRISHGLLLLYPVFNNRSGSRIGFACSKDFRALNGEQ